MNNKTKNLLSDSLIFFIEMFIASLATIFRYSEKMYVKIVFSIVFAIVFTLPYVLGHHDGYNSRSNKKSKQE